MTIRVTGLIPVVRPSDGARVIFAHTENTTTGEHQAYQYVNIPEALEAKLAELGPGDESDELWFTEILGNFEERKVSCKLYSAMALYSRMQGQSEQRTDSRDN
jgi:hypothetical protein